MYFCQIWKQQTSDADGVALLFSVESSRQSIFLRSISYHEVRNFDTLEQNYFVQGRLIISCFLINLQMRFRSYASTYPRNREDSICPFLFEHSWGRQLLYDQRLHIWQNGNELYLVYETTVESLFGKLKGDYKCISYLNCQFIANRQQHMVEQSAVQ